MTTNIMRSVAGELQSLSQVFRKSQGQYLKRTSCAVPSAVLRSRGPFPCLFTCDAHVGADTNYRLPPGMKGREDREKDYGFAAELGEAGAAAPEDDIDFDTVRAARRSRRHGKEP